MTRTLLVLATLALVASGPTAHAAFAFTNSFEYAGHGSGAGAIADCQLIVLGHARIGARSAPEGLDLGLEPRGEAPAARVGERATGGNDATATCVQGNGTDVHVSIARTPGWGEAPPPIGADASGTTHGSGFGAPAAMPASTTWVPDAAANVVTVNLTGDGRFSVAACQLLIGVDVFMAAAPPGPVAAAIAPFTPDREHEAAPKPPAREGSTTAKCETVLDDVVVRFLD